MVNNNNEQILIVDMSKAEQNSIELQGVSGNILDYYQKLMNESIDGNKFSLRVWMVDYMYDWTNPDKALVSVFFLGHDENEAWNQAMFLCNNLEQVSVLETGKMLDQLIPPFIYSLTEITEELTAAVKDNKEKGDNTMHLNKDIFRDKVTMVKALIMLIPALVITALWLGSQVLDHACEWVDDNIICRFVFGKEKSKEFRI